jgi:hypothetical protein
LRLCFCLIINFISDPDQSAGEPIAAVPRSALFGRVTCSNPRIVSLTDRLYPRGAPPLRPLTSEELMKEEHPTMTTFAGSLQLACLLTLENANPSSPFRPWLNVLPAPPVNMSSGSQSGLKLPAMPIMNAAFLDASTTERILRHASELQLINLRGAELNAMVHELTERMGGYHDFLHQQLLSNFVLKTLVERIAKARFAGDLRSAATLFRWALSLADSRANEGNSTGIEPDSPLLRVDPWRHVTRQSNESEAELLARRDRELAAAPLPLAPAIAPLLDFVNHADGDLSANVALESGGIPPLSTNERRMRISLLRRLAALTDFPDPLKPMPVFGDTTPDTDLSSFLLLRATRSISRGDALLMWYAPQIEGSEDAFLVQYGFLPRPLSPARRDEQLNAMRSISDDRSSAESYVERQSGGSRRRSSKSKSSKPEEDDHEEKADGGREETIATSAASPDRAEIDKAAETFRVMQEAAARRRAETLKDLDRLEKSNDADKWYEKEPKKSW